MSSQPSEQKDPAKRPQSAWELARRMEAITGIPRFCRDAAERWWQTHAPVPDAVPERDATPAAAADSTRTRSL